jgi:hypothetical protein
MIAMLALGLLLVAYGSAVDGHHDGDLGPDGNPYYGGQIGYGPSSSAPISDGFQPSYSSSGSQYGHYDDHNWNHDYYDWLSPGGSYYNWWYPTTYYNDWYYTPTYTSTYYPPYYYTTPVYYTSPVVYYDWIDPWWGANVYGFGGTTHYYYGSSWNYHGGFGFGDP